MISSSSLPLLLPLMICIPIVVAIFLIIIRNEFICWLASIFIPLLVLSLAIYLLLNLHLQPLRFTFGNFAAKIGIEYKLTVVNLYFIILTAIIAFVTALWGKKIVQLEIYKEKVNLFYALFLLCFAGFLGILITNDIFNLFVFLEISALASYILIALGNKKQGPLTSFNYLIIGTLGASFYVLGVGILYILFGNLNIDVLIPLLQNYTINPLFVLGCVFIICGICIKLSVFPLFWILPRIYKDSPTAVAALLSGLSVNVFIYVFLKIVVGTLFKNPYLDAALLFNFIIVLSIFSIFVGGILAVKQNDLKLLLGFSSVSQFGFILLGLGIFNLQSFSAAMFILLSHALVKTGLFLCVGNLILVFGKEKLISLKGLGHKAPFTFFTLIFLSLSLAGIPGTSGFWGKLYLIISAFQSPFWFLGIIIIIGGLFSFYYAWKLIENLWINTDTQSNIAFNHGNHHNEVSNSNISSPVSIIGNNILPLYMNLSLLIVIALNITITFYPELFYYYIQQIMSDLLITKS
ncbi:Monovalent cation/H+ antiporter subunit D family protein [Candidatus Hepatincolaceae symbiont of Richtersius coronifer]